MGREVSLERLLGRKVRDPDGRSVGRLEEVRAEKEHGGYAVTEYLIGAAGLRERLSLGLLHFWGPARQGYRARWDQLDISDPVRPRLLCTADALERYSGGGRARRGRAKARRSKS
jgi:hypothetical protein